MSFNKFLNKKIEKTCDEMINYGLASMENRDSKDYFFNKSDLDKMEHFKSLTDSYKLCNKTYYYFNSTTKLWGEEMTEDSVINRICDHSRYILEPEETYVRQLLVDIYMGLSTKKENKKITTEEQEKLEQIKQALNDFNEFINRTIKDHQKAKFAKSVLNFFHHKIMDSEFMNKININNPHLLPLKYSNLNLKTLKMEDRTAKQYFTKALDFIDLNDCSKEDEAYKTVDSFFSDIATGYEPKKEYLRKIMGYFLSGNVSNGRTFYIFYGEGRNGKSALFEILAEVMGHYIKAVESSIIIKKGVKNAGQASPEIEVLDYGLRLALLSETDESDKLNETLIKNISGYDCISYRPLYGKPKNFKSEAKLCMLTNNKPYFKLSQSMVDRLRFIEFKSRFVQSHENEELPKGHYKQNSDLVNELKTIYRQYVLYWCALGAQQFFKDEHMNIPDDKVLELENRSYINEMDSYKRFVDECLVEDTESKTSATVVNEAYKKFCSDEGIPPIKPSKLKDLLMKQFNKTKASSMVYIGFKIKIEGATETNYKNGGLDD
jgi:P4 family phage/plasmid primase-like protien